MNVYIVSHRDEIVIKLYYQYSIKITQVNLNVAVYNLITDLYVFIDSDSKVLYIFFCYPNFESYPVLTMDT